MQGSTSTTSSISKGNQPTLMASTEISKDDSGLHDLKALASSAKSRRNKRRTTQMEAQDSLLASSAALEAVALPDPNKSVAVALPTVDVGTSDADDIGKEKQKIAPVSNTKSTAAEEVQVHETEAASSRSGVYVVLGLAAVAGLAFVLWNNKNDSEKQAEAGTPVKTPVALATSEAETADTKATPDIADVVPNVVDGVPEDSDPADVKNSGDAQDLNGVEAAGSAPENKATVETPEKVKKVLTDEEKAEAKKKREERIAAKLAAKENSKSKGDNGKSSEKGDDKPAKPAAGDSLDDVLSSVTGGLDAPAKAKEEKPVKKTLGRTDVKKAMGKVAGRAKKCHSKEEFSGMVTVKYSVKPDGSLSNIAATGAHSGSPTGKCVVKAVNRAKFPAFAGSPMTFTYPFMLSP